MLIKSLIREKKRMSLTWRLKDEDWRREWSVNVEGTYTSFFYSSGFLCVTQEEDALTGMLQKRGVIQDDGHMQFVICSAAHVRHSSPAPDQLQYLTQPLRPVRLHCLLFFYQMLRQQGHAALSLEVYKPEEKKQLHYLVKCLHFTWLFNLTKLTKYIRWKYNKYKCQLPSPCLHFSEVLHSSWLKTELRSISRINGFA